MGDSSVSDVTAQVINGVEIAARLRTNIAWGVRDLIRNLGVRPGLAVVLVGEDPGSLVYVRNKIRQTEAVGMRSFRYFLPVDTAERDLLDLIARLNKDRSVHGILVQFPLPSHIKIERVVEAFHPDKDVDGFNPLNVGRAAAGIGEPIIPCTPLGVLLLIKTVRSDLAGLSALVIAASNVVGRPMARLLLRERCTVSVAHIHTTDVPERCRQADILVAAAGVPGLIRGSWISLGFQSQMESLVWWAT